MVRNELEIENEQLKSILKKIELVTLNPKVEDPLETIYLMCQAALGPKEGKRGL